MLVNNRKQDVHFLAFPEVTESAVGIVEEKKCRLFFRSAWNPRWTAALGVVAAAVAQ